MRDAWDELRDLLGEKPGRLLLERLRSNGNHPNWEVSLHLVGRRRSVTMAWMEPAERVILTEETEKAHT